jgi:hypothetical protein
VGAEDLAQAVFASGAEVQVVRDGRDHETAIHAGAADPLDGPEPVRHGMLEERAAIGYDAAPLRDRGHRILRHGMLLPAIRFIPARTPAVEFRLPKNTNTPV